MDFQSTTKNLTVTNGIFSVVSSSPWAGTNRIKVRLKQGTQGGKERLHKDSICGNLYDPWAEKEKKSLVKCEICRHRIHGLTWRKVATSNLRTGSRKAGQIYILVFTPFHRKSLETFFFSFKNYIDVSIYMCSSMHVLAPVWKLDSSFHYLGPRDQTNSGCKTR